MGLKLAQNSVNILLIAAIFLVSSAVFAGSDDDITKSYHLGLFHPNGVDIIGFTGETKIQDKTYWFYTYGLAAIASLGLNYYANFTGNGLTGTVGIGIGSVAYTSLSYQLQINNRQFFKLGVGAATSIIYTGAHPVFSYEYRI